MRKALDKIAEISHYIRELSYQDVLIGWRAWYDLQTGDRFLHVIFINHLTIEVGIVVGWKCQVMFMIFRLFPKSDLVWKVVATHPLGYV